MQGLQAKPNSTTGSLPWDLHTETRPLDASSWFTNSPGPVLTPKQVCKQHCFSLFSSLLLDSTSSPPASGLVCGVFPSGHKSSMRPFSSALVPDFSFVLA